MPSGSTTDSAAATAAAVKALLEFLSAGGPIGNFLFGVTTNRLWSMVEGMQIIAMYPLL